MMKNYQRYFYFIFFICNIKINVLSKNFAADLSCSCKFVGTQKTTVTTPISIKTVVKCPKSFILFEGFCYRLFKDKKTFHDSENFCRLMKGAHLISIHSKDEIDFVIFNITKTGRIEGQDEEKRSKLAPIWIGLTDQDEEGTFKWTDGSKFNFNNWYPYEPNDYGDEDCTEMDQNGDWNDYPCARLKPFICKIPAVAVRKYGEI